MKKKFRYVDIIIMIIMIIIGIVLLYIIISREKYTGYCQIQGTYGNRYVRCYGDYSPRAKRRAEKQAKRCNQSITPVSGCTSIYK